MVGEIKGTSVQISEMQMRKLRARMMGAQMRAQDKTPKINLRERLTVDQYNFIFSKAKRKVARCSRRAGKSTALTFYTREVALAGKEFHCIYITKTLSDAKDLFWRPFKRLIQECGDRVHVNNQDHTIEFLDTGSIVYVKGANDRGEIEKIRGRFFKLAMCDEAQAFPLYLKVLIDEILTPALLDVQGTLCLTGTPNASCSGVFYDADHATNWESHSWTWTQNHFLIKKILENSPPNTTIQDIIHEALQDRGLQSNDAAALREFYGQWVKSDNLIVYKYDQEKQHYDDLPAKRNWKYALGCDLGFDDHDAISIVGFDIEYRESYLVEEFKKNKMSISELAHHLNIFTAKYKPYYSIIDEGGLGKKINEELSTRFGLALDKADKTNKFDYVELMNSDLRKGYIKIRKDSELAREMQTLTYDEREFEKQKRVEAQGLDNHLCDSFLYAWRYIYTYAWKEKPVEPEFGTKEYIEAKIKKELDRRIDRINQTQKDTLHEFNRNDTIW